MLNKLLHGFKRKGSIVEASGNIPAENPAAKALAEAEDLLDKGKYVEVLDKCRESLAVDDPAVYKTRGDAFMGLGQATEALAMYESALALLPRYVEACIGRGNALLALDEPEQAILAYNEALEASPNSGNALFGIGNAYLQLKDPAGALPYYQDCLAIEPENILALYNLGRCELLTKQIVESLDTLMEAELSLRRASGEDAGALLKAVYTDIASAHFAIRQYDRAIATLGKAIEFDDKDGRIYFGMAVNYINKGDLWAALRYLDLAIEHTPDLMAAHLEKLNLLEKTNRLAEATEVIHYLKTIVPDNPDLLLAEGQLCFREKRFAEAEATLNKLTLDELPSWERIKTTHLLADISDRQGDFDLAFHRYIEGNDLSASLVQESRIDERQPIELIDRCQALFNRDWVSSWASAPVSIDHPPVFMVGFPRSGTTLLGRILASHSKVVLIDEKLDHQQLISDAAPEDAEYPDFLAELTDDDIDVMRRVYYEQAAEYVHLCPGQTMVDKLPLLTWNLGYIYRLFPNAKILFSMRHCCDVVLSCFMQNFQLNNSMVHFLDLEKTANLYHRTMSLYKQYKEVLPLQVYEVRYENLVDDFESEARRIIEFVGLPWEEGILNYHQHARQSGTTLTPSYAAVSEKIYRHATYRWRNYERQLSSVLPILQPWLAWFDYEGPSIQG